MSGHSKWSTIKHKKAATDAVKGKVFSKMSRAISIAIKTGGGPDPESNYKLRMAIEAAKSVNMPKANIDRILSKAADSDNLEEVVYEGFGPNGIGIMIEVATDNRNRSSQEIKTILERGGGNLAGPGAVSYNFTPKGRIEIGVRTTPDEEMLNLIDAGVEEMEDEKSEIIVYVSPDKLRETKKTLDERGFDVRCVELIQKPNTVEKIADKSLANKVVKLLENLEDCDDVQDVYANVDIDESLIDG